MNILGLSYNIADPFASLLCQDKVVKYVREGQYYEPLDPARTFPENAVRNIFSEHKIDSVAFLGKPFVYLDNQIVLNSFLFPRTFSTFARDISDYFKTILSIPKLLKSTIDEDLLDNGPQVPDDFYYVNMDHALAHAEDADSGTLIITCLADVFEGTSFCCFEKQDGCLRLIKKANVLSSFANLLKIYDRTKHSFRLDKAVNKSKEKFFRLNKRFVTLENNCLAIRQKFLSIDSDFSVENDRLLSELFRQLLDYLPSGYSQTVFITDLPLPELITTQYDQVQFHLVDNCGKMDSVRKYLFDEIASV